MGNRVRLVWMEAHGLQQTFSLCRVFQCRLRGLAGPRHRRNQDRTRRHWKGPLRVEQSYV